MRMVWRAMALQDRIRITDHIAKDNPEAAIRLDEAFEEKASRTLLNPLLYKKGRYPGTREIVVRPNYVIVFRTTKQVVEIIRILHARQQWP
jgi:addiction module RelE/StbE family toxin